MIAIMVHCRPGDEAIMGHLGHTKLFEGGGVAAIAGVMPHVVPYQEDGTLKVPGAISLQIFCSCRLS